MIRVAGALLLLSALCACSNEEPSASPSADGTMPPPALLKENMLSTHATVLVQVNEIVVVEHIDGTAIEYRATALERFMGDMLHNFRFLQFVHEGDDETPTLPPPMIVSLCLSADGDYYVPDLGYQLPVSESLLTTARKIQRTPGMTTTGSACEES